jgi:TetR/AcrR family transcriptional regulator, transcriptional repressor for nem operon
MPRHNDSKERLLAVASELIWRNSYYGTSVDMICERCSLKKGSFYHHFESKEALMVAALDNGWCQFRRFLDEAFSASKAPLERFEAYLTGTLQSQEALQKQFGLVLGCPLYSLGTEIGTQEPVLRAKIDEHLRTMTRYFSSSLREAIDLGQLPACDAELLGRQILGYCEGCLSLARIQNSLDPVRHMPLGLWRLLGLPDKAAA